MNDLLRVFSLLLLVSMSAAAEDGAYVQKAIPPAPLTIYSVDSNLPCFNLINDKSCLGGTWDEFLSSNTWISRSDTNTNKISEDQDGFDVAIFNDDLDVSLYVSVVNKNVQRITYTKSDVLQLGRSVGSSTLYRLYEVLKSKLGGSKAYESGSYKITVVFSDEKAGIIRLIKFEKK